MCPSINSTGRVCPNRSPHRCNASIEYPYDPITRNTDSRPHSGRFGATTTSSNRMPSGSAVFMRRERTEYSWSSFSGPPCRRTRAITSRFCSSVEPQPCRSRPSSASAHTNGRSQGLVRITQYPRPETPGLPTGSPAATFRTVPDRDRDQPRVSRVRSMSLTTFGSRLCRSTETSTSTTATRCAGSFAIAWSTRTASAPRRGSPTQSDIASMAASP
jgi:hypothetical protein